MTNEEKKIKAKAYREANKEKLKAYAKANKEKIAEYQKKYREENKDVSSEYIEKYREENKDKIKNQRKTQYETNKDERKLIDSEYRKNNKDKISLTNKKYREANKEKIAIYKKEYEKNRLLTDTTFKLKKHIGSLIRNSIKQKGFKKLTRSEQILGCTYDEFRTHLESLWQPWMNWENYGNPIDGVYEINKTWDIDHIIPTSTAKDEIELLQLHNYRNLQPLCSYNNRFIKRDNIT
jgi:hypothetical protein